MKHLIAVLSLLVALMGFAHSEEIVVTPKNPNGWVFGVQGSSKTVSWLLGYNRNAPNLGTGDYWLYTGECDGVPYAETDAFKGVPLASITRIGYDTFTPMIPGRGDINIAPEMRIYLDVPGKPNGFYIQYSPGLQGNVPTGRWTSWNPLLGKWYNSQDGSGVVLPLVEWLAQYQNATLKNLRIYAGAISKDPGAYRIFSRWQLGVDNVSFSYALNSIVVYNFEADPVPVPEQGNKPSVAPVVGFSINISPIVIEYPVYYIYEGEPVEKKTPDKTEPKPTKPEETPKTNPYKVEDGTYIPLVFKGNTDILSILSQIAEVGNPDPKLTGGGAFLFGSIPFYIPKENNAWDAALYKDKLEHKMVVKANLDGVTEIHTLMNISNGTLEKDKLFIEFRGSRGSFYRVPLITNKHVRDWHWFQYNTIESPTKTVWSRHLTTHKGHTDCELRLDSQVFKLPSEFADDTLQSVTIVDRGAQGVQRVFLAGMTAKVKLNK